MTGKLDLDPVLVARARALAARAGAPVVELARSHTTVSVERAVLRLAGVQGADPDGIPWVNRLVDAVVADVGLGHGVAVPVFDALAREQMADVTLLAQKAAAGSVRFEVPVGRAATAARR
ncbi:lysine 2,3-aminomutase, partial [Salinispora arenicola]